MKHLFALTILLFAPQLYAQGTSSPANPIEVSGRLCSPSGASCDGTIEFWRPETAAEVSVNPHKTVRVRRDGSFLLHRLEPGSWDVRARSNGRGVYSQDNVWIDGHAGPMEIQLRGSGTIAGQLLDRAGSPIGGAKLTAVPAGEAAALALDHSPRGMKRARFFHERDIGAFIIEARTREDGRFKFSGLNRGQYRILHRNIGSRGRGGLLTEESVPVGSSDLRLIDDSSRAIITVRSSEGALVPCTYGYRIEKTNREGCRVVVHARSNPGSPSMMQRLSYGRRFKTGAGQVEWEVVPGKEYVATLLSPSYEPVQTSFVASSSAHTTKVEIRLAEPTLPGSLAWKLLTPESERLSGRGTIAICSPGGIPLFRNVSWSSDWESRPMELAPGNYSLRAAYEDWIYHRYRELNVPFEILPGETTTVESRFRNAGRLDCRVSMMEPLIPIDLKRSDLKKYFEAKGFERLIFGNIATSRFDEDSGTWIPVTFEDSSSRRRRFTSCMPSGVPEKLLKPNRNGNSVEALPLGKVRLRFERIGYKPLEQTVELLEHEITQVEVELDGPVARSAENKKANR